MHNKIQKQKKRLLTENCDLKTSKIIIFRCVTVNLLGQFAFLRQAEMPICLVLCAYFSSVLLSFGAQRKMESRKRGFGQEALLCLFYVLFLLEGLGSGHLTSPNPSSLYFLVSVLVLQGSGTTSPNPSLLFFLVCFACFVFWGFLFGLGL